MYIPTTFMSSQGSCFSVTTSTIAGNGLITSGSFLSASQVWDYWRFEMTDMTDANLTAFTASFNVLSGSTGQAKLLIVGGGGTGADANATSIGVGTFPNITSYTVYAGGGGGGGGVIYYDQFPISSGSYQIGVGKATNGNRICPPYYSGNVCGLVGSTSYFTLPTNRTYAPFTTNTLLAYGGGAGGAQAMFVQTSPRNAFFVNGPATNPDNLIWASGGGQSGTPGFLGTPLRVSPGNSNYIEAGGIDLGGLYGRDQGNNGGIWCGGTDGGTGYTQAGGAGGGGAATSGSNLGNGCASVSTYVTNGGDGLSVNLTGTSIVVGNGGGGANDNTNSQGVRGSGNVSSYGSGGNAYKGTATDRIGNAGVVIIAIPKCNTDLNICTEYRILGGATGGTITYIPCGTDDVVSSSIDFGFTGSICTFKVGSYPSSTGTVTLTQTGSCNTFIPLQPTVTCPTGSVKTPVYIWDYTLTGTCYPTPSSCQRYFYGNNPATWVDVNGVSQSVNLGPFFRSTPTVTGQLCARDTPIPIVNGSQLPTGSKTNLICGFYCSGSI